MPQQRLSLSALCCKETTRLSVITGNNKYLITNFNYHSVFWLKNMLVLDLAEILFVEILGSFKVYFGEHLKCYGGKSRLLMYS